MRTGRKFLAGNGLSLVLLHLPRKLDRFSKPLLSTTQPPLRACDARFQRFWGSTFLHYTAILPRNPGASVILPRRPNRRAAVESRSGIAAPRRSPNSERRVLGSVIPTLRAARQRASPWATAAEAEKPPGWPRLVRPPPSITWLARLVETVRPLSERPMPTVLLAWRRLARPDARRSRKSGSCGGRPPRLKTDPI
jgi:hypothetical protein